MRMFDLLTLPPQPSDKVSLFEWWFYSPHRRCRSRHRNNDRFHGKGSISIILGLHENSCLD